MRQLTRLTARLLAVPLLVLAGCAPVPERDVGAVPLVGEVAPPVDVAALLARFADFPVERTPRPIVLLSGRVKEYGYTSDEAKIAMSQGRLTLQAALPDGPATVRATLADGAFDLPAISARQAYDLLVAVGDPASAPAATPPPLLVTKVQLGEAEFVTDRGPRMLPAWLFTAPESMGPLAVAAPADTAFWPEEHADGVMSSAGLAADGVTLTVRLPTPPEPCAGQPVHEYAAEAVESAKAVAVRLRIIATSPAASPGGSADCIRDAMLRTAEYTVRLARPLGNRVLLTASGEVS
ncbi:hypothetical protein [Catellatospora citrea]|uniref:Lipoprotein n=1 Tax=Catellatospora citrea TaxID=53366 RepID=A0A8J3P238_9ACTN|nr:hypothetical protein [Catellatospora citrea]RKE10873.1 hypothetical protein C8E86_5792 [Catellatospora citrea]GIG00887.1 hypothetical protein Cci01nite_59800 [Catellatospora citrea]